MRINKQAIAIVFAIALGAVVVEARADVHPLEDIRTVAQDFLSAEAAASGGSSVAVEVGRLDPRLRLQRCSVPLTPSLTPGGRTSGHTSVAIRCEGVQPWSLFVPAIVRHEQTLVVAARPIARGATVTADDVTTVTRLLSSAPGGLLSDPAAAVGRLAIRDIAAGANLSASFLKAAQTIRRGQAVTLSLANGPVAVRVAGTALRDGALGERITVRNLNSRRVVEGVVMDSGVVSVAAGRTNP
jgi:flagella basal body P-ring formation protein FlgA